MPVTIGLATAVCVLAVGAAPSFAKAKEKLFFGEFTASVTGKTISPTEPAIARGHGTVSTFRLGPLEITCAKELKSKGEVTAERSENFTTELKFYGCTTTQRYGKSEEIIETRGVNFSNGLNLEFHANRSANIESPESEVKITRPTAVTVKTGGDKCMLFVPAQSIPVQAEKNPNKEYEAAGYGTEEEAVTSKRFPTGVRERLNILMEFKKIRTEVPVEAGSKCTYKQETEGKYNPETGRVEFFNGKLEAELEGIEVKGGNLGFHP